MNCPSEKSNIYRFSLIPLPACAESHGPSKRRLRKDHETPGKNRKRFRYLFITEELERKKKVPWAPGVLSPTRNRVYRMWEWYFTWVCKEWKPGDSQHPNLSISDEASKVSLFSHQNLRINPFPSHLFAGSTKGSRTSRCQSLLAGLRVWEEGTRERKCRVLAGSCFLQVGRIMANGSPWDSLRARASQFFFLLMLFSFPIFRYSSLPTPSMF